ncbi:hypothetical protein DPEC_G00033330 [Dallia pectoralis]|uniref:Uncharacterized protein n=1 Tax=Dallia pectoralis TaxID=75939 RepID=A0ACC2HCT2_DALPE|nr:hypothetical protein DPEC_G00033330 [Dallia pectoralis]
MSHTNSNIHMAPHLFLLITFFIFSSFSADGYIYVQTEGSIIIPCCYEQKFKHNVKYWCKGFDLNNCKHAAHTDHTMGTKTWITVYPQERVLTVTMTDLGSGDSDYYCCAVEIKEGDGVDIQLNRFYLSVTKSPVTFLKSTSGHGLLPWGGDTWIADLTTITHPCQHHYLLEI